MSREKLNNHIASVISNFAKDSENIDCDVNSNMMIMACTIVGILKTNDKDAYLIFLHQMGLKEETVN